MAKNSELNRQLNKCDNKAMGMSALYGGIFGASFGIFVYCVCKLAVKMGNFETAAAFCTSSKPQNGGT